MPRQGCLNPGPPHAPGPVTPSQPLLWVLWVSWSINTLSPGPTTCGREGDARCPDFSADLP